ncbi:MAG: membrane dipeptidase [Flammeovirgaceae bacterium]|nr:membrane dipeptidase [Flammeovirgaceae bacterium]
MFVFDAHLDLSMNALEWNRDIRKTVAEIRELEKGQNDKPDRGKNTVCLPEMRTGNIGICVATQIARYVKPGSSLPGWQSQEQAWAQTQGQLAWYKVMEELGEMIQVTNNEQLENQLNLWLEKPEGNHPIGYILSLEGADSIVSMKHLEKSYSQGLRALGPAHYGPGVYAYGTDSEGGLGKKGRGLLKEMENLNIILDATHLCDESFWEAMDNFQGHVWASHSNCRALVPHNRQFADEQIKELINRGAVIGGALDAWMMVPGWVRGKSDPARDNVSLIQLIDNIDRVCQIAGNSLHSGIGTDLDGGFGKEQCPHDLETIQDLQKVPELLKGRGFKEEDVENIIYKNWIRFLKNAWK